MKEFFARVGYILMWVSGTPEYSLEEKFEEYYRAGLILAIIGIVAFGLTIVNSIIYLVLDKKSKEVEENEEN